ncbi:glycosyl hydrolase 115 family protein [Lactococcus cremoris]|uniref:glycosyl hydrolase 115 family protein n=1 Tax=Lactococcus lactis subsp. cremoris TaxID=1359 RepID=UPI001E5FE7A4|nr:glycosyl hydrolase 115 family protein [Lactococcus cremoris]ARD91655.2 glycosyl hydrolase 115 family protein [Lactococcus cremoris]WKT05078.1 glycosyl hydrolase 115 family protein [Lactococcus cremoris]
MIGNDRRGTIYAIYEFLSQIGVSPWHYWMDVPIKKQAELYLNEPFFLIDAPKVEMRGFFINDEWPAAGNWATKHFGHLMNEKGEKMNSFNHLYYEKLFDLLLRLKGNFIWPAMWDSAFYADDPENSKLAQKMGVIIGTSHHEPMGRNHQEWIRNHGQYGNGDWDYESNQEGLEKYFRQGIERSYQTEDIFTLGMRGNGDEAMGEGENISLLEQIINKQRKIISEVTGRSAKETPQIWALYKEVQDYYDKGMRVPDDVILLLCDDNWGNLRKLPSLENRDRKGGFGIYYHYDYVGGPRNSKWINVSQIQRTWEQITLAYNYGVRKLWVVNVGDLKGQEYPLSYFMDLAWNPEQSLEEMEGYTKNWVEKQLGGNYINDASKLLAAYSKLNMTISPELLDKDTFSLEIDYEFERILANYRNLSNQAGQLFVLMPEEYRQVYEQLIYFPLVATANLYEMYYAQAINWKSNDTKIVNQAADKVEWCFKRDAELTSHYNSLNNGKWEHMMSQTHIGYHDWQEPEYQIMPEIRRLKSEEYLSKEIDQSVVIEAADFNEKSQGEVVWTEIADMGKTFSAITPLPNNIIPSKQNFVCYDFETSSSGEFQVEVFLSPSLNWNNSGLIYGYQIDDGAEVEINFNGKYKGELGNWQADRIIRSLSVAKLEQGKHRLLFYAKSPDVILQKIVLHFGEIKETYLGRNHSDLINSGVI